MQFICPRCAEQYEIEDDGSGGSFICTTCGNEIIIPPSNSSNNENSIFNRVICKSCGKRINTEALTPGQEFNCPFCKTLNKVGQNTKNEISLNTIQTEAKISASGAAYDKNSQTQDSIPTILGKCKIEKLIGYGAMGYVFKATHTTLNIPVAIKVLRQEYSNIKNYSDRFIREAQTAAKLNHQNIIRVYDCGYENNMLYLIMEYVDGGSLADELEKRGYAFEPEKIIDIGIAIAQALVEAEKFGIIHRDIKPANIMKTRDDVIKLADLGLAKQIKPISGQKQHTLTMDIVAMGTPVYMPPEQAIDAKKCDIRADIYALGITLYHLLVGRPPFLSTEPDELFKQHQTKFAEPPSKLNPAVPKELDAIILKCIMKRPEERYQSPRELLEDLNLLKNERPLKYAISSAQSQNTTNYFKKSDSKKISLPNQVLTLSNKNKKKSQVFLLSFLIFAILAAIGINLFLLIQLNQKQKTENQKVKIEENSLKFAEKINTDNTITLSPTYKTENNTEIPKTISTTTQKTEPPPPIPTPESESKSQNKTKIEKSILEEDKTTTSQKLQKRNYDTEKIEIILSDLRDIYNFKEFMPHIEFRENDDEQPLKQKLLSLTFSESWQRRTEQLAKITQNRRLPPPLIKKLRSVQLASNYIAETNYDDFSSTQLPQNVIKFDKTTNYTTLLYTPTNITPIPFEISGDYKIVDNSFILGNNSRISFSVPFVYDPHNQVKNPIITEIKTNELTEKTGILIKFNLCIELGKIEELPNNIKIYFVVAKKDGKTAGRLIVKQTENELLKITEIIPEQIIKNVNLISTIITPDSLTLKVNNYEVISRKINNEHFLRNLEFMYPELVGYQLNLNLSEINISGQIAPIWLAAKFAISNDSNGNNNFVKWMTDKKQNEQ